MADPRDDKTRQESEQQGIQFADERQSVYQAAALVLHPDVKSAPADARRSAQARLDEAVSLAAAIELDVREARVVPITRPRPATLFGSGKVEEIAAEIAAREIELVVVDAALTPLQQRNLERDLKCKVIDRTGLILEIFGERAATKEGRLQVDLAHLTYQKSRLVRSWTHLERQRGGQGFMGGPGERQIESDRRQLQERIDRLNREIKNVARTRTLHRKSRAKVPYPIIAFVGYTNAGKSTLFNRLTNADVLAKDLLFATLDPTLRGIDLPGAGRVIASDTVGFVSDLPTELVAAFRATLEEVLEADLIIHVRDISHSESEAQCADVMDVLKDLGVPQERLDDMIEVLNKADLLDGDTLDSLQNDAARHDNVVVMSALTGQGIEDFYKKVDGKLSRGAKTYVFTLQPEQGAARAFLHQAAKVQAEKVREDGSSEITAQMDDATRGRFDKSWPDIMVAPNS